MKMVQNMHLNQKNLKTNKITVIDSDGNEVQKVVFIDDKNNIIDEKDIDYTEESYIDEFGNKITKKVTKIKDESFKRMQREAIEEQRRYSNVSSSHKVLKDVVEIDEFGNKKIVQKLVDEDGPKRAPKSKDLKANKITVMDSDGNEVKKAAFVDDQNNIIDENDIDFTDESYIDEFGSKLTKKVAKIKDESFKRMQIEAIEEQRRHSNVSIHKVLKDVVE